MPAPSRASTAYEYVTPAVTELSAYTVAAPTAASSDPPRNMSYQVTPTSSVLAFQLRVTDVADAEATRPVGVLGGVTSMLQLATAGVGSVSPFAVAKTENECGPAASPL